MNDYLAGSTSVVETVFLQDSASTVGAGKTGLVYNTASLTCYYKRSNGTASVSVSLADISTLGTFVSGGFKAIDGTNMPGLYEFHPPNAALAAGAKWVTFYFQGAAGLVVRPIKVRLMAVDPDTANAPQTGDSYPIVSSGTHGNAALKTLIDTIDDLIDTEVAAILADTNELQTDWANGGRLDLILDARSSQTSVDDLPTNAELATALAAADDAVLAAIAALNNLSQANIRSAVGLASADLDTQIATLATAANLATVAGYLDTEIAAILADTNELQTDWVNGGRLDLLIDSIKSLTDNLATAIELDGAVYRFTTNALEQAPGGGGSNPFQLASGTIGSTGNSTTTLHLDGLTQGDDELNDLLIVVRDISTGEYHSRWILDWVLSTELATVAALPFTPQDATDTYTILGVRQDVTGGAGLDAAGVRAAIGLASANLDTQLSTIDTVVDSILVDTAEIGAAGAGLTNINLPNQTMDIVGDITGSLSGSVGSVAAGGIAATSFAAGAIDSAAIATDAIGANELAASAVSEIQSGLATSAALTSAAGDITTLLANLATLAAKFTGITLLSKWLGIIAGKTADAGTLAEVNATTAGAGYLNTTDSLEAIRDYGAANWGGGGGGDTLIVAPISATYPSDTITASGTTQAFRYCPLPSGPLVIVDALGAAVDLSAGDLKMICVDCQDNSITFTLTLGVELTVGGVDDNEITVDYLPIICGKFKRVTFFKPTGGDWITVEIGFWQIFDGPDPR